MAVLYVTLDWRTTHSPKFRVQLDTKMAESGHVSHDCFQNLEVVVFGALSDRATLAGLVGIASSSRISDVELVAKLYYKEGLQFLDKLSGDYALIIWDENEQKLHLVRNHAGTRPLYYARDQGRVYVASNIQVIVDQANWSVQIDETALAAFMHAQPHVPEATLIKGIRTVAPAHCSILNREGEFTKAYWNAQSSPLLDISELGEAAEELKLLLKQVVHEATPAAGHIGVHLTGGLDSSAVAYHVNTSRKIRNTSAPIGFTWQPKPAPGVEEKPDQKIVAIAGNALALKIRFAPLSVQSMLSSLALDPVYGPTEMLAAEVPTLQAAYDDKVSHLFSGWGGDEFISYSGRNYFVSLLTTGRWGQYLRDIQKLNGNPIRRSLRDLKSISVRLSRKKGGVRGARGYASVELHKQVVTRELISGWPSNSKECQVMHLNNGHLANRTDAWSIAGARFGIQYCYPLLDRRIIEFALGLPDHLYRPERQNRRLMRESMRGLLPRSIVDNSSKDEPARVDLSLHVIRQAANQLVNDYQVAPERAQFLDIEKLTFEMTRTGGIQQPHKLLAALQFAYCSAEK